MREVSSDSDESSEDLDFDAKMAKFGDRRKKI